MLTRCTGGRSCPIKDCGLHGIELIVSDAHEGLQAARKAVEAERLLGKFIDHYEKTAPQLTEWAGYQGLESLASARSHHSHVSRSAPADLPRASSPIDSLESDSVIHMFLAISEYPSFGYRFDQKTPTVAAPKYGMRQNLTLSHKRDRIAICFISPGPLDND